MAEEYFKFGKGHIRPARWRRYWKLLRLLDAAADARVGAALGKARTMADRIPVQRVLLAGVEVPKRAEDLAAVVDRITNGTRHAVTVATAPMAPVGKFDNINRALAGHAAQDFDWLMVIDDDIEVPDRFLDLMLYFAHSCGLKLAQPAHRFLSYASFAVTERHWTSMVRRTSFVEIGPVSLLHRDTFADLLPFPSLRWAWGLDILWADLAKRRGWKIGVVDAVPIRHLRPVGGSYNGEAARDEAVAFLTERQVAISRAEMLYSSRRIG